MDAFNLFGNDLFGEPIKQKKNGPLAQRFEFPPFSVLSARDGLWQERKRMWIGLGIQSELGRGDCTPGGGGPNSCRNRAAGDISSYGIKSNASKVGGGELTGYTSRHQENVMGRLTWVAGKRSVEELDEVSQKILSAQPQSGTSIFDPVLCELVYRWFCPKGGIIVDPFAGGSVRGIVGGLMGYKYHGIDLSERQIEANYIQHQEICPQADIKWVVGDSIDEMEHAPQADFIFSCPPYGDLERYSDDSRDLSTMEYHTFLATYKRIILRCWKTLKQDRFACFVVGDFRDTSTGYYRGFVADTINAFREVGMHLYNDAILLTAVGSLPIRVSAQFEKSRKLGKTHQNILVFAKGDPKRVFA